MNGVNYGNDALIMGFFPRVIGEGMHVGIIVLKAPCALAIIIL